MHIHKNTYRGIQLSIILIVFMVTIGFVGKKQNEALCKKIEITIENQQGNFFINEADINELVTNYGKEMVINLPFETIDLKKIETRLNNQKYIETAQVYRDLSGVMKVDVIQERPIARIFQNNGKDHYISERGEILPVSKRFTARVMVVSGSFFKNYLGTNMVSDEPALEVFKFIQYIEQDEFWSAQFAQMNVSASGEVEIYPQVTKQLIEFGSVEHYQEKLSKLKIFYDKILPDRGWNRYNRVNLKFENQIICE